MDKDARVSTHSTMQQERARRDARSSPVASAGEHGLKATMLGATPIVILLLVLFVLLIGVVVGATGARILFGSSDIPPRLHSRLLRFREGAEDIEHLGPLHQDRTTKSTERLTSRKASHTGKGSATLQPDRSGSAQGLETGLDGGRLPELLATKSLEDIMYHYRSDKSKDDKKYCDLYAMLFDPIRTRVVNVTQVGMGDGGSVMVWHDYFRKAQIYGMDHDLSRVQEYLGGLPRVHLVKNSKLFSDASMDVVFESAGEGLHGQQRILTHLWRLVRPGGYYVIEDVSWDTESDHRTYPLLHQPWKLSPDVKKILSENDAFFADPTVGHRAWDDFINRMPGGSNRYSHAAHVIVIKKAARSSSCSVCEHRGYSRQEPASSEVWSSAAILYGAEGEAVGLEWHNA